MREEKEAGFSRLKPEVRRAVSYRRNTRSFAAESAESAENRSLRAFTMACLGLSSMVFLAIMYWLIVLSRRACARIILSMLALQPNSPVTREQGDPTIRSEITTFSTLLPRMSLTFLHSAENEAFSSSAF